MPEKPQCSRTVDNRVCILLEGHRGLCAAKPTLEEILTLEARYGFTSSARTGAILALGVPWVRWHQLLNNVIDTEAALRFDAITTNRLRRLRDQGADTRRSRLSR